jgi:hypothetical protein
MAYTPTRPRCGVSPLILLRSICDIAVAAFNGRGAMLLRRSICWIFCDLSARFRLRGPPGAQRLRQSDARKHMSIIFGSSNWARPERQQPSPASPCSSQAPFSQSLELRSPPMTAVVSRVRLVRPPASIAVAINSGNSPRVSARIANGQSATVRRKVDYYVGRAVR